MYRSGSTLAVLLVVPLAACQRQPAYRVPPVNPPPLQQAVPEAVTFPSCPDFRVVPTDVTLTAAPATVEAGDVTLVIPAGAVEGTLTLSIRRGTVLPAAASVQLNPSTTFRQPITLSMSYARCPDLKGAGKTRSVYRVDVTPPRPVGGSDDPAAERVSVQLNGLSEYATATP